MARTLCCLLLLLWTAFAGPLALAKSAAETAQDGEDDLCKGAVLDWFGDAGDFAGNFSDVVIDPIVEYFTTEDDRGTPGDERMNAAIRKALEGAVKVTCPTCGVVIDGGRFIVGQTVMQIEEFYAQGRRISAGRMIFGGSKPIDAYLGSVDRLLTSASFFGDFLSRRSPPITPDNLGQRVRSPEALRRLWFTEYRTLLKSRFGGLPSMEAEFDRALRDGWPLLERYWGAQRAGEVLDRLSDGFMRMRTPCRSVGKRLADVVMPPAALACPMPNAEPIWLEGEKRHVCHCRSGYLWNANRTACMLEPAAQVAALHCAPGAQARWDIPGERAVCDCRPGLSWNRANTACIPDPAEAVAATRCQPNAEAYWNDEMEKVRCRCTAGKAWNAERTACVSQVEAQIAAAPCEKLYPNSETYADKEGKAACRCKTGFVWQRAKSACLAPEKPDKDLSKLLDDVAADSGNAAAADRGERSAANDARDKSRVGSDGPSTLRQQAEGPNLMTALLQGLTVAVAQSQGVPVPGGLPIPGVTTPTCRTAGAPQPGRTPTAPSGPQGAGTPASGADEIYMMTASAFPTSHEYYRNYPACRYQKLVVRSALVSDVPGGRREIEAAASALRARGHDPVQVWYYPESRGVAPFQEWDRTEKAGYDACWQATRNTGGGR